MAHTNFGIPTPKVPKVEPESVTQKPELEWMLPGQATGRRAVVLLQVPGLASAARCCPWFLLEATLRREVPGSGAPKKN